MLFSKFYSIQKNVSVIFASKLMNLTDCYDKLLQNLYVCLYFYIEFSQKRMTYRKNKIILRYFCFASFSISDFKISVDRISCKYIHSYYIAPPY